MFASRVETGHRGGDEEPVQLHQEHTAGQELRAGAAGELPEHVGGCDIRRAAQRA